MVLLHRIARIRMANKLTLIQIIVINFSCAQTARWLWKHAKMVFCSMARATFTITATTIGLLSVEPANLIVSLLLLSFWQVIYRCSLFSATPISSPGCEYAFGIYPESADCSTSYLKCAYGEPHQQQCDAGLAYDERIHGCNWPDQLLHICNPEGNISSDEAHSKCLFIANVDLVICSRRRIHMSNKDRWTISPFLAIPTIRHSRRPTPSHHMRWRTSTSHFVRRRFHLQWPNTHLRRTLNYSNVIQIRHWKISKTKNQLTFKINMWAKLFIVRRIRTKTAKILYPIFGSEFIGGN